MLPISTLLKRGQVTGTFDWLMPGRFLTNTLQMVSADFFPFNFVLVVCYFSFLGDVCVCFLSVGF